MKIIADPGMKRAVMVAVVGISLILVCEVVWGIHLVRQRARLEAENRTAKTELAAALRNLEEYRRDALIRRRAGGLRGLEFKRYVPSKVMKRAEIRDFILGKIEKVFSEEELDGYELALKLFGLIPDDADIKKIISDLYSSQAGGFYDQHTKILYRVAGMPLKSAIMAHEYTHALQDQHFDLSTLPLEDKKNDDLALAAQCLVEGDAMIVTMDYLFRYPNMKMVLEAVSLVASGMGMNGLREAPPFFSALIQFPYLRGKEFVDGVKSRGGWGAVNRLYADPPQSSEQIMHPEKYLVRRDDPRTVKMKLTLEDLKASMPGSWRLVRDNVMGEYSILLLLRAHLSERDARIASEGWGGDRYMVYRCGDNAALVWSTVWDTPLDAGQFFFAVKRALPKARIERIKKDHIWIFLERLI